MFRKARKGGQYWSAAEHEHWVQLVKKHGRDYEAISNAMGREKTKAQVMIRTNNLYSRAKQGTLVLDHDVMEILYMTTNYARCHLTSTKREEDFSTQDKTKTILKELDIKE